MEGQLIPQERFPRPSSARRLCDSAGPYFGLENSVKQVLEVVRSHNCLVIEDLAHAALANELNGDYGVTSLQKFYPVTTGGELLISTAHRERPGH